MNVDEFGLGDWWPRPDQAAAGALDHLPVCQWPMLAAKWLAAGFDSPSLRQLAKLRAGESRTMRLDVLDLMPKAMRSIGFAPGSRARHVLAPVGQLTAKIAKTL
jgi:hypothetical protein